MLSILIILLQFFGLIVVILLLQNKTINLGDSLTKSAIVIGLSLLDTALIVALVYCLISKVCLFRQDEVSMDESPRRKKN